MTIDSNDKSMPMSACLMVARKIQGKPCSKLLKVLLDSGEFGVLEVRSDIPKRERLRFDSRPVILCPKEKISPKGSLDYTQQGVLLFLCKGGPRVSCYNAFHTPVTYGIPSKWTQKLRNFGNPALKPPKHLNGQGHWRNVTLLVGQIVERIRRALLVDFAATYISKTRTRGDMIAHLCQKSEKHGLARLRHVTGRTQQAMYGANP